MTETPDYAPRRYSGPASGVNHVVHDGDEKAAPRYVGGVAVLSADTLASATELGKALRTARENADLSQKELATLLGEQQSWVSRMEKGQNPIEIPKMVAWFKVCGQAVALQCGEPGTLPKPDPFEGMPAEDRELLEKAVPLLASAPTARERLAFEIRMWAEEARAAIVTRTVASAVSQIGSLLTGKDADAMRLLQERVGLTPDAGVNAGARAKR